jgi:hypothetical protein
VSGDGDIEDVAARDPLVVSAVAAESVEAFDCAREST